jgi:basic amino acid/polyamine antiporter, APA family
VELTRTKSIDDVLEQNASEPEDADGGDSGSPGRLKKSLGALDLMGFGIGIVIGTGIFTLTGVAAKDFAGPAVMLSFALAGIVSLLAALCYAELSSAVPTAGSAYTYAYATIGEVFAWIIGWDLVLEFSLGAAVVARGWSGYVASLSDAVPTSLFGESAPINVGAVLIVLVLGVIAWVGIRESKWVTNTLVVIKVLV